MIEPNRILYQMWRQSVRIHLMVCVTQDDRTKSDFALTVETIGSPGIDRPWSHAGYCIADTHCATRMLGSTLDGRTNSDSLSITAIIESHGIDRPWPHAIYCIANNQCATLCMGLTI